MNFKKCLYFAIIAGVLCFVTGAGAETGQFRDNGNGTITDMYSGLTWSKEANQAGKGMTWNEAKEYVKKLELAGHKDWRLPSKAEFQSLGLQCPGWMIEHWMIGDWLKERGFTFTEADKEVWLSGEMATDKNYAYSAALTYWGVLGGSEKSSERLVWPVRSGRK